MNDEYSEAFKSIVPDAPSADGWADGARRKRRNHRRVMTGVAGAAVLALAVPFALTLQNQSLLVATPGESNTASPIAPDPAQDAPGAAACWEAPGQPRTATDEGATEGAVRAWLCGDAGNPESFPGTVGPLEPLVEGVDDIIELVQMWEAFDYEVDCTADGGSEYRIVFDYGDGSHRVMSGMLDGCDTIEDGEQSLPGARDLYDRALELWSQQRERVDPPADVAAVSQCRPPSRSVVPDLPPAMRPMLPLTPADAVTGFICHEDTEYEGGWAATLDAGVVTLIADSLVSDSEEGMGTDHLPTWVTIAGPWGEALTLQRTDGDTFQWFDAERAAMLWTPSSGVRAAIDAVVEQAPPPGPPPAEATRSTPSEFTGCSGVDSGEVTSTDLPGGKLPEEPSKVWLCVADPDEVLEGVAPWEPLESPDLMADAVYAYNVSHTTDFDPACLDQPGLTYSVVHEYADGTTYVVDAQVRGCDVISADGQVREGGRAYVDKLLELWVEQRNATPQSPPVAPSVGICENNLRSVGRGIDRYDEDGALCAATPSDSGVKGVEIPAPGPLLDDVRREAQDSRVPSSGEDEDPLLDWEGESIVLVDDYGDRLSLFREPTGEWFWEEGDASWTWTPSTALAERLEAAFNG